MGSATMTTNPPVQRRMLFGERSYGIFFVLWGISLQIDCWTRISPRSSLFSELEFYAPGWVWGLTMILIGIGRFFAHRARSSKWRIRLSSLTIIVLWLVAATALWAGMIGATFPLACFAAVLAQGFHRMLARDIELGL